jgi:hypothetical protein
MGRRARPVWLLVLSASGCGGISGYALDVGGDLVRADAETDGGVEIDASLPDANLESGDVDVVETSDAAPDAGDDAGQYVYWAAWLTADAGTVSGVLSLPSGPVLVTYSGDLTAAQTGTGNNDFLPASTFTSPTVPNAPPGPDMIEVSGITARTETMTFSEPVTNPVLAIYNLGTAFANETAAIYFQAPITVLSSGVNAGGAGYWGNEMLTAVDGGVSGVGANGVVEIEGTFTSVQWTNPSDTPYASWTGLTIGVRGGSP